VSRRLRELLICTADCPAPIALAAQAIERSPASFAAPPVLDADFARLLVHYLMLRDAGLFTPLTSAVREPGRRDAGETVSAVTMRDGLITWAAADYQIHTAPRGTFEQSALMSRLREHLPEPPAR
jgi:hypothetical protein